VALIPCPECKKDGSDKAAACPQCGMPLAKLPAAGAWKKPALAVGVALFAAGAAAGIHLATRPPDYSRVEELRAEQDAAGTHDEHVRQRYFRLFQEHPKNAMYAYLWSRCLDDPAKQLEVAEQGILADPRFAYNYNVAARALARLGRAPEALARAEKGAGLDPANMQLADKRTVLKLVLDHKLGVEPRPAAGPAVRYRGLFHGHLRSPDRPDLVAVEHARLPDHKGPVADVVRGFTLCANPVADACIRVYVPTDPKLSGWAVPGADVSAFRDHQVITVSGAVVTTGRGENILLADSVAPEAGAP
jgi:hypothetical protein